MKPEETTRRSGHDFRSWPLEQLKDVFLEMGWQCNVRCSMCFQTDFSPAHNMPEIVWKERLRPAYSVAERLSLTGGEPTILRNCRALVEIALKDYPNLRLVMATNGLRFQGFWEEAFLARGAYLNFSLNAVHPDLYNRLVRFSDYETVTRNIDRIVARKRATGSQLVVRISSVVVEDTIDEMPAFVQWAADHGLDQVLFSTDHLNQPIRCAPAVVQKRIAEAYEAGARNPHLTIIGLDDFDWFFARRHGLTPVRPRRVMQKEPRPCPVAFDTLYVMRDGTAKPCCKSWYVLGNLVHSSLEEIWNGHRACVFRRRMMNLDFRDCLVSCDLNPRPLHPMHAEARKAMWVVRRDPRSALRKALRRLGLTSAQDNTPVPVRRAAKPPAQSSKVGNT